MVPFALRRPWLMLRDLWIDRDHPNLEALRAIRSPERFLWAILPHAARTFSASIALLPAPMARAAAVGYLYCRILDTYEDLAPSEAEGRRLLRAFARRFGREPGALSSAPGLHGAQPVDQRDRSHLLLVECCDRIDRVYEGLPHASQLAIVHLVRDMAGGMIWARRVFETQGGCLQSRAQLEHYCHAVLGNPVAFAQRLILKRELTELERRNAMQVGEFIQLANVCRDVEKDLERGVAYHRSLRPHLGVKWGDFASANVPSEAQVRERCRAAKARYFEYAMERAPAYTRMLEQLSFRRWSLTRASALLMLEFTDRFYRGCAERIGRHAWPGPRRSFAIVMSGFPSFFSHKRAMRRALVIEKHMTEALEQDDD